MPYPEKTCGNPWPFEWPLFVTNVSTGWHPEHECQPRPPFPRSCGEQQGGSISIRILSILVFFRSFTFCWCEKIGDSKKIWSNCCELWAVLQHTGLPYDYRDDVLAQTRRWYGQTTCSIISCIWVGSIVLLTCIGSNWCLALHRQWWIEGQELEDSHLYCSLGWDHNIDQLYIL